MRPNSAAASIDAPRSSSPGNDRPSSPFPFPSSPFPFPSSHFPFPSSPFPFPALFSHNLHHNPLSPPSVEFGVIHLLPGAEIHRALRDGDDHLVMDEEAFQVRVAVRFP